MGYEFSTTYRADMIPAKESVSACLIIRNEEMFLENCLKSIRNVVDEIVIVDTGSIDNSINIAKKYADKIINTTDCNDNEGRIVNFSSAREKSFQSSSCSWKLWIDGDDELVGSDKLRGLLKASDEMDDLPTMVVLPYEYSHDPETNRPNCILQRERLMKPWFAFSWEYPVHEIVIPRPEIKHIKRLSSEVVKISHQRGRRTKSIEKGRNLRILKEWNQRNGNADPRQLFYLGIEYGNEGMLSESIETLTKYLGVSGWDDEKCIACLKIAEYYGMQHKYEDQLLWSMKAQMICESWGETYFMAARALFSIALQEKNGGRNSSRNWDRVIHYICLGLSQPITKTLLFTNPMERSVDAHKILSMALIEIEDFDGALKSILEILKETPNDAMARNNKMLLEQMTAKKLINNGLLKLIELGALTHGQGVKIMSDIENPR